MRTFPRAIAVLAAASAVASLPAQNDYDWDKLRARTEEIMADAAYIVLTRDSRETTGNFFVDEEVLESEGITDLDGYALEPGSELIQDLFL